VSRARLLSWRCFPATIGASQTTSEGRVATEYSSREKDRRILHALDYAQDLRRGMSGFSNFAISFTIISVLSGTLTLCACSTRP
jgi:hypothetical protein